MYIKTIQITTLISCVTKIPMVFHEEQVHTNIGDKLRIINIQFISLALKNKDSIVTWEENSLLLLCKKWNSIPYRWHSSLFPESYIHPLVAFEDICLPHKVETSYRAVKHIAKKASKLIWEKLVKRGPVERGAVCCTCERDIQKYSFVFQN